MRRTGAQFVFIRTNEVLRNGIVEQDAQDIITKLFSLDACRAESAHTVFHSGILIALPYSVAAQDFCRRLYSAQLQNPEATAFELLSQEDLPPLSVRTSARLALVKHLDWATKRVTEQTQVTTL